MTGLDKIIDQILTGAKQEADEILSRAKAQADAVLAEADREAEKNYSRHSEKICIRCGEPQKPCGFRK